MIGESYVLFHERRIIMCVVVAVVLRAATFAVLALQDLIKALVIGQQPTAEQWDIAKLAVDSFITLSQRVQAECGEGHRRSRQIESTLDVN